MFEQQQPLSPDQQRPNLTPPVGGSKPTVSTPIPEDMFATTEPVRQSRSSPFVFKTPPPRPPLPPQGTPPLIEQVDDETPGSKGKGVLLFIGIVLVVGIAVGAGAFFLTRKSNRSGSLDVNTLFNENRLVEPNLNATQGLETNQNINTQIFDSANVNEQGNVNSEAPVPLTRNVNREEVNVNIPLPEPLDRDKDGLTLEQESALGTSDNLVDTDLDGLTDWDEVKVYQSDPLNPDTDGDGYIDGSEVKKGYSPIISGQ